jgi:HEPN domain-containing protein
VAKRSTKSAARPWVEKAEADFVTAQRELRARKQPNYDAACFHAQQCIEKYLKAWLAKKGIVFARTHDLEVLLDLIVPYEPAWDAFRGQLIDLSSFAVSFRYPGDSATRDLARLAVKSCKNLRQVIASAWDSRHPDSPASGTCGGAR